MMSISGGSSRSRWLGRALRLEWLTVGWNIVEGGVGIAAALAAGSTVLLGFGIDSFVESISGSIMIWRLMIEGGGAHLARVERVENLARRLIAASLLILAIYIGIDAGLTLWRQERPRPTFVGIALTLISIGVMIWLGRAKRRAAIALQSRALESDVVQTTACWWLSIITLTGIGLNAIFGWWWADPLGAFGLSFFLVREARESWSGDECAC
ncbi:MAG TPA: cation transporter [Acidobacteriota bacterium]|nr:cation transporter [Acidobacteriota bacterium]